MNKRLSQRRRCLAQRKGRSSQRNERPIQISKHIVAGKKPFAFSTTRPEFEPKLPSQNKHPRSRSIRNKAMTERFLPNGRQQIFSLSIRCTPVSRLGVLRAFGGPSPYAEPACSMCSPWPVCSQGCAARVSGRLPLHRDPALPTGVDRCA